MDDLKAGHPSVGAGVGAAEATSVEEEKERRKKHVKTNLGEYAGLLGRACPAGVYEYVPEEGGESGEGWNGHKLVINSQVRVWLSVSFCSTL